MLIFYSSWTFQFTFYFHHLLFLFQQYYFYQYDATSPIFFNSYTVIIIILKFKLSQFGK